MRAPWAVPAASQPPQKPASPVQASPWRTQQGSCTSFDGAIGGGLRQVPLMERQSVRPWMTDVTAGVSARQARASGAGLQPSMVSIRSRRSYDGGRVPQAPEPLGRATSAMLNSSLVSHRPVAREEMIRRGALVEVSQDVGLRRQTSPKRSTTPQNWSAPSPERPIQRSWTARPRTPTSYEEAMHRRLARPATVAQVLPTNASMERPSTSSSATSALPDRKSAPVARQRVQSEAPTHHMASSPPGNREREIPLQQQVTRPATVLSLGLGPAVASEPIRRKLDLLENEVARSTGEYQTPRRYVACIDVQHAKLTEDEEAEARREMGVALEAERALTRQLQSQVAVAEASAVSQNDMSSYQGLQRTLEAERQLGARLRQQLGAAEARLAELAGVDAEKTHLLEALVSSERNSDASRSLIFELQQRLASAEALLCSEQNSAVPREAVFELQQRLDAAEALLSSERKSAVPRELVVELQQRLNTAEALLSSERTSAVPRELVVELQQRLNTAEEALAAERACSPNDVMGVVVELEQQLASAKARLAEETSSRNASDALVAELQQSLALAEARLAEETLSRNASDALVAELRQHLASAEARLAEETSSRNASDAFVAELRQRLASAEEATTVAAATIPASPTKQLPSEFCSLESVAGIAARGIAAFPESSVRRPSAESALQLFGAATKGNASAFRAAVAAVVASVAKGHGVSGDAVEAVMRLRDEHGQTLLHVAVGGASEGEEKLKFLLGEGKRWFQGRKYMLDLQSALLERQFSTFVNSKDMTGATPLLVLCSRSDGNAKPEIAMPFLEAQADLDQRDNHGRTPFLACVEAGNVDLMRLLLRATRGSVLSDRDVECRTPLHSAAGAGQRSAAELLLKVRAPADSVDQHGRTPLDEARAARHAALVELLSRTEGDEDEPEVPAGKGENGRRDSARSCSKERTEEEGKSTTRGRVNVGQAYNRAEDEDENGEADEDEEDNGLQYGKQDVNMDLPFGDDIPEEMHVSSRFTGPMVPPSRVPFDGAGARVRPRAGPSLDPWSCPRCTLENVPLATNCLACDGPRPR